jgi:hypothetical protein
LVMTDLERAFTIACHEAIAECRKVGYSPTVWSRMIADHGAVVTAQKLIKSGDFQDGLLRLLKLGRSDLTIEHAVQDVRWQDLFTDEERELARWRLETAQHER